MSDRNLNDEEREIKEWREWCRFDQGDAIGWAAVFIWGGLVLLAQTTNFSARYDWWDAWGVFFAGVGGIVLIGAIFRVLITGRKNKLVGGLIFGLILLAIGLGGLGSLGWIWPLVLFSIAVIILVSAFARRR